jgi:formylglycine-generating enzyme required for sulfatase activity
LQKTGKDVISIRLPNLPKDAKDLEMVLIQTGTFTMGAPMDDRGRNNGYDWPEHKVSIT